MLPPAQDMNGAFYSQQEKVTGPSNPPRSQPGNSLLSCYQVVSSIYFYYFIQLSDCPQQEGRSKLPSTYYQKTLASNLFFFFIPFSKLTCRPFLVLMKSKNYQTCFPILSMSYIKCRVHILTESFKLTIKLTLRWNCMQLHLKTHQEKKLNNPCYF